jgi:DNA-binding transcriptional LysR family regulator
LRQGVEDIELLSDPGAGEVRIGSPDFLMVGLVATIVDRMGRESPRTVFHAVQGTGPALSVLLRERKIDAVIDRGGARQTAPDDFVSETLFDEQFFIVAGPQSRWLRRRKIDLAELVDEPWIMPTPLTAVGTIVTDLAERFRARGVTPPKSNVVSDSMALRGALLATGRYLSVLPESTLQFATERLQVKVLPVDMPAITQTTEITTFRNRSLSPVLKRFIDCTRETAKSISDKSGCR